MFTFQPWKKRKTNEGGGNINNHLIQDLEILKHTELIFVQTTIERPRFLVHYLLLF